VRGKKNVKGKADRAFESVEKMAREIKHVSKVVTGRTKKFTASDHTELLSEATFPGSLLVERFPVELRKYMRAVAALQGRTLREVMIEAAADWFHKHGPAAEEKLERKQGGRA